MIGSALLSTEAAKDMARVLQPKHFRRNAHRIIWTAILDILDANIPIDIEILKKFMGDHKIHGRTLLEEAGGEEYVLEVSCFVPSPANAMHYAGKVLEDYARAIYGSAGKMAIEGVSLADVESKIEMAKAASHGAIVAHPGFQAGMSAKGTPKKGIPTGYQCLDGAITSRGWPKGQQSTVAAKEKVGKSSVLLASALHAAQNGYRVIYASFADMDPEEIDNRWLKMLTGWDHEPDLPHLQENWHNERSQLNALPLAVYCPLSMRVKKDMETYMSWLYEQHRRQKVDITFLDYAQRLSSRDVARGDKQSQAEVCSEMIDDYVRELNMAAVVGSQLTTSGDGGNEMTKWSRVWQENTAFLVKLSREFDEASAKAFQPDRAIIKVGYNRFGNSHVSFKAQFNRKLARFEEVG